jgi:NAD(P)-dependent dehydrogenase (short-subunit alcohol dehydrogenase family)
MAGSLEGRVAWVTGGASGIGRATTDLLAKRGARVGVIDRQAPAGGRSWVECDIADPAAVRRATAELARLTGYPDILVNNAGINLSQRIDVHTDEDWSRVLAVNLSGAFHMLRACMPPMLEKGWGRLISVSSGGAVRALPARAAYASSKAGLIALTKVAAMEAASRGVTANVVAPGLTDTEMAASVYGNRDGAKEAVAKAAVANPMGVLLDPIDIAEAIAFLASSESRYVTGQVLHVNAGSVM